MSVQKIAFLGVGIMGAPMIRNLASAGHEVTAWNRTRAKAEALSGLAKIAETPAEAASGADVVLTMLADGRAVGQALFGADGAIESAAAGTLFLDMSSIAPPEALEYAARLDNLGYDALDAPVSGGEVGAIEAKLVIFAGGAKRSFLKAEPIFSALGKATYVGESGSGQIAKLANQIIVGVTIGAVAEALNFAAAAGCDPTALRSAMQGGLAQSRILELHGERIINKNWVPGGKVRTQSKDLENANAAAKASGRNLPLLALCDRIYQEMKNDGTFADLDHSAYALWLRRNG